MEKEKYEQIVESLFSSPPLIGKKVINININKQLGVTSQHMHVLLQLNEKGSLTVSQLACNLDICKPNITPLIQKLIDKGYVERNTDEKDRRYIYIRLSDDGKEFLKLHKRMLLEDLKSKMMDFTEDDFIKLDEALQTLRDFINRLK